MIETKDVPESYFELQRRIAREQGHGDINITPDMRRQLIEAAQAEQRAGLEQWVEYLGGEDGGYPDWFKHYTWESLTKLGAYDKDKKEFKKRSRGTVAPYPELNREALAYVYDKLAKSLEGETPENEELARLVESANFGKFYAYAVLDVTPDSPELRKNIEGSWRKYDATHDPRTARRLSESLQGHGTGWCTAGESTAAAQLATGDFYVYYSRDLKGKDTIPRAAIRMQHGEVAEVRGVNANQNLEGEMAEIAMDKLRDLPGGLEYQKKADDMHHLTVIDQLIQKDPETILSAKDIRFLYELDHSIQGFGYERDPRVDKVKQLRGERDKPEIVRLLPEVLIGQAKAAYSAYKEVAGLLGSVEKRSLFGRKRLSGEVVSEQSFVALLEAKDAEWRTSGVYDYIAKEFMESGGRPNLVATPNIIADWSQLKKLAEQFGAGQPYPTSVYEEIYRHYTDEQLSGPLQGTGPVRLSIIPSSYTKRLGYNTAAEQRAELAAMQQESPALKARIPSVLDTITYWYSLRQNLGRLDDDAWGLTYTRYVNLPEKVVGGWPCVPRSDVSSGKAGLRDGRADNQRGARVAVG